MQVNSNIVPKLRGLKRRISANADAANIAALCRRQSSCPERERARRTAQSMEGNRVPGRKALTP